jgi:rare lipoprotein A
MRYAIRGFLACAALTAIASCSNFDGKSDQRSVESISTVAAVQQAVSDEPAELGAPYTVGGTSYTPQDTAQYDEVGYAGHYGGGLAGRQTANGETFRPAGASAAHKTLPMPSYVEVTSLDTGRTILVRVNDRGPLNNDRLIDLSEGAARQLGIGGEGVAGVRVRRVNPPEQEKSVLREGMTAAERIETPVPLLKVLRDKLAKQPRPSSVVRQAAPLADKPVPSQQPASSDEGKFAREGDTKTKPKASPQPQPAAKGDYVAQIGAFSSRARADALARKAGALVNATADGRLFRVRFGPFATGAQAITAARQKGYPQARVYRD